MTSQIPPGLGLIAGDVALSLAVHHFYMGYAVISARNKYKIKYPALYATSAGTDDKAAVHKFNCIQRGHQNSLETQPIFLASLVMSGLQYPVTAASVGLVYLIGRIIYFNGYSTGLPNNRFKGFIVVAPALTILGGMCCRMAFSTILAILKA